MTLTQTRQFRNGRRVIIITLWYGISVSNSNYLPFLYRDLGRMLYMLLVMSQFMIYIIRHKRTTEDDKILNISIERLDWG